MRDGNTASVSVSSSGATNLGTPTDGGGGNYYRRLSFTASSTGVGTSYGTITIENDFG